MYRGGVYYRITPNQKEEMTEIIKYFEKQFNLEIADELGAIEISVKVSVLKDAIAVMKKQQKDLEG